VPVLDLEASNTDQTITTPTESELQPHETSTSKTKPGMLREFLMAFVTIFLAEIGDKTQLATLLMTAESKSPWVVFAGAAAALMTTSLLGVLIGRWLARRLSADVLETATGAGMLVIAVLLLWDVVHLG
jgi:putative Ca2+/H+ antiporter (TMEM165/GDT1 family)